MILFGRWGSLKSMLAMHTCFCISQGKPWFGFSTYKSKAYYVQVEIPKFGFQQRVIKYVSHNHVVDAGNIIFDTVHYLKLDKGYGMGLLEKEMIKHQPKVLCIDPIYKVVSGRITDEYDMRQFTDRLDELMYKYKLAIILIHHDRKQQIIGDQLVDMGADDMFGSSIFPDWTDTAIKTVLVTDPTQGDGEIRLTFYKARNAYENPLKPFNVLVRRRDLTFTVQ